MPFLPVVDRYLSFQYSITVLKNKLKVWQEAEVQKKHVSVKSNYFLNGDLLMLAVFN